MKLLPTETILAGSWLARDGKVHCDVTCERIDWLITHHLQMVAHSPQSGAWETLYKDPDDRRFWERTYPQGEMHGGGPPTLRYLTTEVAVEKYGAGVAGN